MQQAVASTQLSSLPSTSTSMATLAAAQSPQLVHKLAGLYRTLVDLTLELACHQRARLDTLLAESKNLRRLRDRLHAQLARLDATSEWSAPLASLASRLESNALVERIQATLAQTTATATATATNRTTAEKTPSRPSERDEHTFYEARYGFSQQELLTSEFREAKTTTPAATAATQASSVSSSSNNKRLLISLFGSTRSQPHHLCDGGGVQMQVRGFKTRSSRTRDTDAGNTDGGELANLKNAFNSLRRSGQSADGLLGAGDYFKKLNAALSSNQLNSKQPNALGSLFGSNASGASAASNANNASLSVDDRVKVAFAEGLLYKQGKQEGDKKRSPWRNMLVTYGIIGLLVLLYNTVSITSSSNGGKGGAAGGGGGGGINIRALTGAVNFEINPEMVNVHFDDVKGLTEAKKELTEIVDFLKEPEKYTKLGARLPKGILLVGKSIMRSKITLIKLLYLYH